VVEVKVRRTGRSGDDGPVERERTPADGEVQAVALPAGIARAWGLQEAPGRGPRPGLTVDRIVAAGVALAGAEGLAAVSMGRVAAQLGASTMALYRHVTGKEELLRLMVDAAYGEPPPLEGAGEGWRAGMGHWARASRSILYRHPWILGVPISGPPILPREVAWMEQGLATMRRTGLTEGEKLSVILLVSGFVRNEATLMAGLMDAQRAGHAPPELMTDYGRILAGVVDAERHPAISAALAAGVFDDEDHPDAEFLFGLERLLDGVEVLVLRRERPAP
jgi:AcrR family transcriptional regulator